jgi:23S rRNA (uridine2479-2'-O)-methyltransferase
MPKIVKIYSENDIFQNLETLKRNRDKRNKLKEFLFEGVRNINNALEYGWQINSFIYSPERKLSSWATEILKLSSAKFHIELPLKLLEKLSGKEETSELLATAQIPKDDLARIPTNGIFTVIVFDRPASPGNLGALIRSCDALGADGLIVTGHAVDVYDPETISATTGSIFSVPVVRLPSHKELLPWIKQLQKKSRPVQLVATDEKGAVDVHSHDFTKPTILLMGNETWGLSAAYREMSDVLVKIPIKGSASSLNVSNAGSIVLYEISRQRKGG